MKSVILITHVGIKTYLRDKNHHRGNTCQHLATLMQEITAVTTKDI